MKSDRRGMTVRIVSLHSQEAGDSRVEGTVAERLKLLADLSRRIWALTGQPVPTYTRRTMPVQLTSLRDQA